MEENKENLDSNGKTSSLAKNDNIRYVAAVRQPHHEDLNVEAFCFNPSVNGDDEDEMHAFEKFSRHKLRSISDYANFYSCFYNHMGTWHIKGVHELTYIVVTREGFPETVATECLDEFSEAYQQVSKKWIPSRRIQAQAVCCQAMVEKYSSVEVESASWMLMHDVDEECRLQYSKSVQQLVTEVKRLEDQMHENIKNELQNMEKTETIEALTQDCLEKAKVFRKRAKEVKRNRRRKHRRVVLKGTAACATIGGVVGFLAGGPGGAFVLTSMSVAEAQAIEAAVVAVVFGTGFLATQSKVKDWSWSQKFILL